MSEDVAGALLEAAQSKCERAEVFEEWAEIRSVRFEHNNLKRITTRQFRGVGLRIFHEGRIGFASSTDLRDPRRLIVLALQSAEFGEKASFEFLSQPEELPEVQTEDSRMRGVSARDMVEMGREGLQRCIAANGEYLFDCDISCTTHGQRIVNSNGLDLESSRTGMAAAVSTQHIDDSGLLEVYEWKSWGRPFDSVMDITETALHKMKQASAIAPTRMETMPVLFTAKAVGILLDPIMMAASGKLVYKGSSVLRGRIGERIVDERITVVDDATVDFAPGSAPFDCEGVPVRPLPIIEKGVLKSYLLDLRTASLLKSETTGHGYRGYGSQPAPSSSNTVVSTGSDSTRDMIAGMERGVIVDQVLGSGQSNVLAGEFSVNVSLGLLVEDGKIGGRVKDCMIAGNCYEVLNRIEGIGSERQWVGSDLLPPICVGGLKLAAQQ